MPEIDIATFALLAPVDLESRRKAIITKAAGSHDNLTDEELHELAAITGVLRRRASGPPKEAKKAPGAKRTTKTKASVDDLA